MHRSEVPDDKLVTYNTFVCNYRPLKQEACQIRITIERYRLTYDNNARSLATNLLEIKLLLNSTISDTNKGACFITADIKVHFLAIPMKDLEYMQVKYHSVLEDIRRRYDFDRKLAANDYIYAKIKKDMPGLK